MSNPFPFVAASVLTAAELNGIGEAWTSFTPVITIGNTPTFTTQYSKYARVNKIIMWRFSFLLSQAGTASNAVVLTLPVTSTATGGGGVAAVIGAGQIYVVGTNSTTTLVANHVSTTTMAFSATTSSGGVNFGASPAATLGISSYISGAVFYEAA